MKKKIEFVGGESIIVEGDEGLVRSITKGEKSIELIYQDKSLKISTDFRFFLKDLVIEESK